MATATAASSRPTKVERLGERANGVGGPEGAAARLDEGGDQRGRCRRGRRGAGGARGHPPSEKHEKDQDDDARPEAVSAGPLGDEEHDAQERQEGRDREEDGASDAGEGAAQVEELVAPDGVGEDGDRRQVVAQPIGARSWPTRPRMSTLPPVATRTEASIQPSWRRRRPGGQRRQENAAAAMVPASVTDTRPTGKKRCGPPTA